ncbi:hypothetical protein RFM68_25225 [Mesorhizobium sp. MSK_1335]|uniref:Restriction alleviation protein, Lar family n=1 Tax=Mesorhizobium montanum TaxID=3072323 RepID=A0ABU4ZQW9_9HYPH|nr:hypothetical protein [Mesorhizobium sp. MSK_1335]MDX8527804.1 hypothetical protein [Mesorhizobium sp. MSK_1335]
MNVLSFERRYYPSKCPICAGTALEAEITLRKVEFQCASCGAFEITSAARTAMKGLSQESRGVWLAQARQQHSTIPLVACANETTSQGASGDSVS